MTRRSAISLSRPPTTSEMPYTSTTYTQAKAQLAERLYYTSAPFWPDAELGAYILEALQSFNAFANFYRSEFVFPSVQGGTWYDLTNQPGTLRPFTTTDTSLISLIEYHLLEPQNIAYPLVWAGSKQFAFPDILAAIQQLRDQLLSESGCTLSESLVSAVPGRTFLPDSVTSIRRVCWIPAGFGFTPNCLLPSDIWGQQSFEAGFPQLSPGYPLTYRRSSEPPLSFDVDIQPAVPGQYDTLTMNAGTPLSLTAATTLPVPDDWTPIVKYGALAQLFSRGSAAEDPFRAQYCAMRYKQGVAAMTMAPALIAARIGDVPVTVEAVTNADFYAANWQGLTPGTPVALYYAGLNMVALAPAPDVNGPYSVTASVVRNMVLPASDADFIQVGRDDMNAVLDYAQHIAMLKCGGAEFAATFPLYQSFMRHCALYNSKLKALSPYLEQIDLRSVEDQRANPLYSKPSPAEVTQ